MLDIYLANILIHKLMCTLSQVKHLGAELDKLRSTLDSARETLEAETLGKVDLQNNIQSLKEELAFRKVYEEVSERERASFKRGI